jgi:hypothetical protein
LEELRLKTASWVSRPLSGDQSNPYVFVGNDSIGSWDAFGLYKDPGGPTIEEMVDVGTAIGLIDAAKIQNSWRDARKCAARFPQASGHGGEGDAVRHCTWLCLMTKAIGFDQALEVGALYEDRHPPPKLPKPPKGYSNLDEWERADQSMDAFNNLYGAQLGAPACGMTDTCCTTCAKAASGGFLKVNQPGGYRFEE